MIGFVIQSWRTVRVAQAETLFYQAESEWLDLAPFEDLTLWCDVKSVLIDGADVALDIVYETAPERDDALFRPIGGFTLDSSPSANPVVTNAILDRGNAIARWFRWKLEARGTLSGPWGACFRLLATATPVGRLAG